MTAPAVQRFWKKVDRSAGPDGCWPWLAAMKHSARGGPSYGILQVGYRPQKAHRFSWEMHFGPIPPGLCVLHRCDNPPCVNPAHLWLGTERDNVADMIAKGRHHNVRANGSFARGATR